MEKAEGLTCCVLLNHLGTPCLAGKMGKNKKKKEKKIWRVESSLQVLY